MSVTEPLNARDLQKLKKAIEADMFKDFPEFVKEVAVEQVKDTQRATGKSNISF